MHYVHNIVIYDNHTEWFDCGDVSCQICSCSKHLDKDTNDDIYGYISLELESPYADAENVDFLGARILCKTEKDYHEAYNRCCEAIMTHPKVIDLRGLDAKLEED